MMSEAKLYWCEAWREETIFPAMERIQGSMQDTPGVLKQVILKRPIVAFVTFAYGWAWIVWIPSVLLNKYFGAAFPLLIVTIGAYGPVVAAVIVTAVLEGRVGVRALFRKLTRWRVGFRWYLTALFACSIPTIAVMVFYILQGGNIGIFDINKLVVVPLLIVTALPNGPLGEELGWRGFLLPRLTSQMNLLKASMAVGIV